MARFNFIGPSYVSQSINADGQDLINWYMEQIESGVGKSAFTLYPTPGLKQFVQLGKGPVRGGVTINGRTFFVSGTGFYEVTDNHNGTGTSNKLGDVLDDGLPASLAASSIQVLIASAGQTFLFTLATNNFAPVAQLAGINVSQVGYADTFFFALLAGSQKVQASAPLDGTTWNGADFSAVSWYPENVVGMAIDHREILLFGAAKTVFYYDAGDTPFPYDPVPGGFVETGIAARDGWSRLDNSVFWWGQDERGAGVAWRAQGYLPTRISDHGIETAVQSYSTIADAISYAYQDQGHPFWVTYFPSANTTLAYDVTTQKWHKRGYWNLKTGAYDAHLSRCHVYSFGKHLVGDRLTGWVYWMNIPIRKGQGWDFVDDSGNPIRRLRRTPVVSLEDEWMFFDKLVIDAEVGLGPEPPLTDAAGNPRDPQGVLRWSDDSGKTWKGSIVLNFGQAGNYATRAVVNRLGKSRKGRVFEFTVSDPIPWRITDAWLYGTGLPPSERLIKQFSQRA